MGNTRPTGEQPHQDEPPQPRARGRRALGHRVSAVLLAAAAAVAGGITTDRTNMLGTPSSSVRDATEFEFLPVEEDEAELALAPYEDPALLDDVPVNEGEVSDEVGDVLESSEVVEALGESGIPEIAIEAYTSSEGVQAGSDPGCGLRWTLLAAIGRVESDHGRFGGAQLREDGYGTRPIRGIPLDGRPNVALIRDTDGGELDGDTAFDRAVGPLQFIPSTWRSVGQDGNDDGRSDPNNIFDAAQGAGAYLCADDANLNETAGRARAVRRYNNADEYVRVVLSLAQMYETGRVEALPDLPVPPPAATPSAPGPQSPTTPQPGTPPTPTAPPPPGAGTPPPVPPTPPPGAPTRPGAPPAQPAPTPPAAPPTTQPVPAPPATPPTTSPATVPSEPTPPTPPATPETPPPSEPAPPATPPTTPPDEATPTPPATPPAAVGWAPAMREVVVDILTAEAECAPAEAPVPAPAPADGAVPPAAPEAVAPREDGCEA